jgi:phthalate 4,5-cis-dihydrodiol dehydrogenase
MANAERIRVGIAGLGAAGQAFIAPLKAHARFEWVAFADPAPAVRERMQQAHGVAAYDTLAAMLAHERLEAVYIATPTPLHADHVRQVAAAGKHVLVEKPMAATLDDARAMVAAAEQAGVCLIVGHSHSYDAPIARMRELIDAGEIGSVRMVHTWCYTDWVHRPRRLDELDTAQGGGVTFRQGSHQFDVIRLLCGGRARSVRAQTFDWNPQRRVTGAHTVFITFEDGAVATAVYNGYGGLSSIDLCFDIGEWGQHLPAAARAAARPAAAQGPRTADEELQAKQARAAAAIPSGTPHQPFFGLTLVSGERGDLRQSPDGLLLHTADGVREIAVARDRSPRDRVLDEWQAAIRDGQATLHSGRWGLANLEVCVAALASSAQGREIALAEQVGIAGLVPQGIPAVLPP